MSRQRAVGLPPRLVMGAISVLAAIGVALPVAAATQASSEHTLALTYTSELGKFLTDSKGMSLYLYTKDRPGVSNCYGSCANIWPPLLLARGEPSAPPGLPGRLGLTTRTDGTRQVTYNGIPLYYWIGDRKAGETNGHGVDDEWYVVNPAPTVQIRTDRQLGNFLVDAEGMTLYLFTRDQAGVSNCTGNCANIWRPLVVSYGDPVAPSSLPGKLGLTTRRDGARQVTYNGKPLYYWAGDRTPGETSGHGVENEWFLVKP